MDEPFTFQPFTFRDSTGKLFKVVRQRWEDGTPNPRPKWGLMYWDDHEKHWLFLRNVGEEYLREWMAKAIPAEEAAKLDRIHEQYQGGT